MQHRGIATFTLDYGKCPPWLFERMVKLSRSLVQVLVAEYGPDEFVRRIADPVWFQSLGTVLAFDWNASGLTTILTAALKEAIRGMERDLGIFICGGKGKTSLKTPDEIANWSARLSLPDSKARRLIYNSKMSAKVDSGLIQDGYQLYHHAFFFSRRGAWTVIQQGMNTESLTARRYHWYGDSPKDLINEPHTGIIADKVLKDTKVLNMTSSDSAENRKTSLELVTHSSYYTLMKDLNLVRKHFSSLSQMVKFEISQNEKGQQQLPGFSNQFSGSEKDSITLLNLEDKEFHHHPVEFENFSKSKYLEKILYKICDRQPDSYEHLVAMEGVGPKTIRALSLVSEVLHGAPASYKDPARYSFAHGGKDATPYPVDTKTYDQSIDILRRAVLKSRIDTSDKNKIVDKLVNRHDTQKPPQN